MKVFAVGIVSALVGVGMLIASHDAAAERIGDLARVQGMTDNPLVGYGLVVGLPGTGDTKQSPFTRRSLVSAISRLGVNARDLEAGIRGHNVAAVMVTARLSPFMRKGGALHRSGRLRGGCHLAGGGNPSADLPAGP